MSSNDFIKISKEKDGYIVSHRDADTGEVISIIGDCSTLEAASEMANKFEEESEEEGYPIEYGIRLL